MDNNFHPEQVGAVLPESQPRPPKECFSLNREVVPETDLWLCGLSCDFCSAVCCFQQTVQWKRRRSRVSKPAIQEDLEEGLAVWILVSYWSVDIPFFHLISMELRWESSSQEWLKFMKPTGYQCVNVKKIIFLWHTETESSHLLVHSPKATTTQVGLGTKPGAENSIWISRMCGRSQLNHYC